jgi:glycosyltransferase involved in cell wall biosynthesis
MQDSHLVTIGILSYNRPNDLRDAILSVINQTYSNLEIIISDNGSKVIESKEIIKEFAAKDNRIKFFLHDVNQGPLFNFEFLLKQAKGEYFIWLADDDYFLPNYIEDCVKYFDENPGIVAASNMPVDAHTRERIKFNYLPNTNNLSPKEKYNMLIRHVFFDLNLFFYSLFRTSALKQCKYFLKKAFGNDTFLLVELLKSGDIFINTKKEGFAYRVHSNQTSNSALQYKKITVINSNIIERRFFFSAPFIYWISIIMNSDQLSFLDKLDVLKTMTRCYFATKKHHLIKYDLGLNNTIQKFKSPRDRK